MIEHSLNGILLFKHFDETTTSYIVCNPTTQKYTMLSPGWSSKPPHVAYLAFDPSKSPHYKVVLVSLSTSQPYQIDVYSSHNACWKEVLVQDKCCNGRGVFWNGAIHWLTDENVLLRFDIDTEVMIAVSNPPKPKILSLFETLYFGVCGGGLVLIQSRQSFPDGFRILELNKDYSSWSVKYRVDLRPLRSRFPAMNMITYMYEFGFRVLHVLKGKKEKEFSVVIAIPALATGRIILYNPKCRTWDVLPDLFPGEFIDDGPFYPFVETLCPI